jgi:hypothetical protein
MTSSEDPQLNMCETGICHVHFVRVYEKGRHIEKFSLDLAILKLTTFFTYVLKTSSQLVDTQALYWKNGDLCFFCRHLYQFLYNNNVRFNLLDNHCIHLCGTWMSFLCNYCEAMVNGNVTYFCSYRMFHQLFLICVMMLYCSILLHCMDLTLHFAFMPSMCHLVTVHSSFFFIDTTCFSLTGLLQVYSLLWLRNLTVHCKAALLLLCGYLRLHLVMWVNHLF